MQSSVALILDFLSGLYKDGSSYSAINSAKSAVTMFIALATGRNFNNEALLFSKFMKGIFALRPSLPKYGATWDVSVVLDHLDKLSPPDSLSLLQLTRKLATLLALLSGQRGQTIHLLEVKFIECSSERLILRLKEMLKMSKPGRHLAEIVLPSFSQRPGVCVVSTYQAYIKKTRLLRKGTSRLFLSTLKPHGAAARDTVSKWVKAILLAAGIDFTIFAPHSTRAAATSKAAAKGISISTIMSTAGWEKEDTFRKFYQKPIARDTSFASSILQVEDANKS